jgi:hypothetical protein
VSEPRVVLGPLFTAGLALGVYGLVRRKPAALAAAVAAVVADRLTKLGHGAVP